MNRGLSDAIDQWEQRRGHEVEAAIRDRLQTLWQLWATYGRSMNLTGSLEPEALLSHVVDGLDTAWCVRMAGAPLKAEWLDVGSGGGFPGLVVVATDWFRLTLVEPRQKRAAFLELAIHAIELESTKCLRMRIERSTWSKESLSGGIKANRTTFCVASARAVFAPGEWLDLGINVVEEGGHVVIHLPFGADAANLGVVDAEVEGPHGIIAAIRVPEKSEDVGV